MNATPIHPFPSYIPVRSEKLFAVSLLKQTVQIQGIRQKSTAGTPKNEHPCSFLGCQFAEANWLLLETTAIRGGSDTLSIYCRSGTDAAGLNRSDISALPKFAIKSVHGCTLLMMRRSRCAVYFKRSPFENRRHRCQERTKNTRRRTCCTSRTVFCEATTQICCIFAKEEVINILIAEYDYDTDIAVQREEAGRIAFAQGISQGISQGSRQTKLETAAAFKRFGFDIDKIAEGTGLSREEIEKL